jgi:hypothetical protein
MSTDYSNINYVFLALGLINGLLFVTSETIGFLNRHSLRSTSVLEMLLRRMHCLREPSLEEVLEHLHARRADPV